MECQWCLSHHLSSLKVQNYPVSLQAGSSIFVVTTVTFLMLTFFILPTLRPELGFLCRQPENINQYKHCWTTLKTYASDDSIHSLPLSFPVLFTFSCLDPRKDCLTHPACGGDLLEHWGPLLVGRGFGNHSLSEMLRWTKWAVGWISRSAPVPADTLPLNRHSSSIITPGGANRRPTTAPLSTYIRMHFPLFKGSF